MQLPLQGVTGTKYTHGATRKGTNPSGWQDMGKKGAIGLFELIAYLYISLADWAWVLEYWGEPGDPEPAPDPDVRPPAKLDPLAVDQAKEATLALRAIDDLFETLVVHNPELPDGVAGGRRPLQALRLGQVERVEAMVDALTALVKSWLQKQLRENNIEAVFSSADQDRNFLKEASTMWEHLNRAEKIQIENAGNMGAYLDHEQQGFFRLVSMLVYRLENIQSVMTVANVEADLLARILHIFLYQYDTRGDVKIFGPDKLDKKASAFRVAYRFDEGNDRYDGFADGEDPFVTPSNVSALPRNFDRNFNKDTRRAMVKAFLEDIGGKLPGALGQDEPTEEEQARGAQLLYNSNNDNERETNRKKRADAKAIQREARAALRSAMQRRAEAAENRRRMEAKELEKELKRQEEERERKLGLQTDKLILKGWERSRKDRGLPSADEKPWTWAEIEEGGPNIGSQFRSIRKEALDIFSERARREDARGEKMFQERQRQEMSYNLERDKELQRRNQAYKAAQAEAEELGLDSVDTERLPTVRRPFFNQWRKYSYNLPGKEHVRQEMHEEGFQFAWDWKNHNTKKMKDYKNGIARHLWFRVRGYPLPEFKETFPEMSEHYYTDVNEQHRKAMDWMRGRVPRPLLPAGRSRKEAKEAKSAAEIRDADELRCQVYEAICMDYQIDRDPRLEYTLALMTQSDRARLQLEYERFMSEEHRHLLDVLKACGGPDATRTDLENCYEADKASYAKCPPEEEIAAMAATTTKPRESASRKRYWYERTCRGDPYDSQGVPMTVPVKGKETNPNVNSSVVWTDPDGISNEDAKLWLAKLRASYQEVLDKHPNPKTDAEKRALEKAKAEWTREQFNDTPILTEFVKDKPCEFKRMPQPGDDGYAAAVRRFIQFKFQIQMVGNYRAGKSGNVAGRASDYDLKRYKAFWNDKINMPLTWKMMDKEDLKAEGLGTQQGEKGIFKILLKEFQAAAEKEDPDYFNPEYIGEQFATYWFDKGGDKLKSAAYREKVGEKIVEGKKGTPAVVIHTFQSDLLERFPVNAGSGDNFTAFNDIMDFICWFMKAAYVEWPELDLKDKTIVDRMCQILCLPAWSTWNGPQGGRDEEDRYYDYRVHEDVGVEFKKVWLGVFFAKKALDFAMVNPKSFLNDPSTQRRELANKIRAKWASLTNPWDGVGLPEDFTRNFGPPKRDGGGDDDDDLPPGGNDPGPSGSGGDPGPSSSGGDPGPSGSGDPGGDPSPSGGDDAGDDDGDEAPIYGIPYRQVRRTVDEVLSRLQHRMWKMPSAELRGEIYEQLEEDHAVEQPHNDEELRLSNAQAFGELIQRRRDAFFQGVPLQTVLAAVRAVMRPKDYQSLEEVEEALAKWFDAFEDGKYRVLLRVMRDEHKAMTDAMIHDQDSLLKTQSDIAEDLEKARKWDDLSSRRAVTDQERAFLVKLAEAVEAARANLDDEETTLQATQQCYDALNSALSVVEVEVPLEVPLEYAYADTRNDPNFIAAATDDTFKAHTRDYYSTLFALQRVSGRSAMRPDEPYEPATREPELIEHMAEIWYHLKENPSLERALAYLRFYMEVINYIELNLKLNNPDMLPQALAQSVLKSRYDQALSMMEHVHTTKGLRATEADFAEEAERRVAVTRGEMAAQQQEREEQEQAARQAAGQAPAPVADPASETGTEAGAETEAEAEDPDDNRSIAARRGRRTGSDARAGEGEVRNKINLLKAGDQLVSLGIWSGPKGFQKQHALTYTTSPYDATYDQWKQIFEAIASNKYLAILKVLGSSMHENRHSAFLELLAEYLPKMSIIALNIGEFTNASREAFEKFETALGAESCIVAHLYYSEHQLPQPIKETKARLQDQLTRNRYKLAYCEQLVRDEVWRLHGMHCWVNFLGTHHNRAKLRVAYERQLEADNPDPDPKANPSFEQWCARAEDKIKGDQAVLRSRRARAEEQAAKPSAPAPKGGRKQRKQRKR